MFTIFVMGTRRVILAAGFLAGGVMLAGSVSGSAPDKLSAYAYEDTRRLVALVEQAAKLMEEQGENAFSEFGRKGSKCLILCEKINDAEWSRPDIRRIGDGLMADAIAVTASGVFGGVASDTSASNVALSTATGATSRWIGFAAGGLFILLGFSPKLSAVLSIMPTPVMGAIIVFVASFMIVSSLQIILSSKPDTRKTFVIGIPLIFGLSLQALPELYAQVVPWLRPLFGSALTLATVLAVGLNLLLRIGGAKPSEGSTISTEG